MYIFTSRSGYPEVGLREVELSDPARAPGWAPVGLAAPQIRTRLIPSRWLGHLVHCVACVDGVVAVCVTTL